MQTMKKHEEIFQYIVDHKTLCDGNSPSIRMIGQACGIKSTSLVQYYLGKLIDLELIMIEDGKIHVYGGDWRLIPGSVSPSTTIFTGKSQDGRK